MPSPKTSGARSPRCSPRFALYCTSVHQYADDCQVYLSIPVSEAKAAVNDFSRCVGDLSAWLSASRLRFNPVKTVVIWLGAKQYVMRVTVNSVQIMSTVVPVVDNVRDLGVVLDSHLAMSAQVSSVCRSAFYQLRRLRLSPFLNHRCIQDGDPGVCILTPGLLQLFYSIFDRLIRRLQAVQNAAARLVTGTRRRDHISPVLLHWLPVRQRMKFKLAVLVYGLAWLPNNWLKPVNSLQLPSVVSYDRRTLPRSLFHEPTLVSVIGHSQLLDHGCGTAFRRTYDSPTLPFFSSAGR